jgi:hypothetical protein
MAHDKKGLLCCGKSKKVEFNPEYSTKVQREIRGTALLFL